MHFYFLVYEEFACFLGPCFVYIYGEDRMTRGVPKANI